MFDIGMEHKPGREARRIDYYPAFSVLSEADTRTAFALTYVHLRFIPVLLNNFTGKMIEKGLIFLDYPYFAGRRGQSRAASRNVSLTRPVLVQPGS
jgi:hypothetical protein